MTRKGEAESTFAFGPERSTEGGRETVTDALEAYMLNGHVAIDELIVRAATSDGRALLASYIQGAAAIHAAELTSAALDRLTAAIVLAASAGRTAT